MRDNRPRTHEDRIRRLRRARNVEARIVFLDEPPRRTVQATCGACGQRLGWWDKNGNGEWRTDSPVHPPAPDPEEDFIYSYGGYPDTGYEVVVIRIRDDPERSGQRPRISSTGGHLSRDGRRIGRRPRTTDGGLIDELGTGMRRLTTGQIVTLPADVYCPTCKTDTLNTIPVPQSAEGAM